MEPEFTFASLQQPVRPFASPLAALPRKTPADALESWRAMSAERASDRVVRYSDTFVAKADGYLDDTASAQEVMDSFADFAAEFQGAKMHLDVHGLLSDDLRDRLLEAHRDLVEVATRAVGRADFAIAELDQAGDRAERMREFLELAKPRIKSFHEFFLTARNELRNARKMEEQPRMEMH